MDTLQYSTPLRYPGGKGKLSKYIKFLLLHNDLLDIHYVEPYAGGAGVALSLLFHEYASRIYINDIDRAIYAFWHSVLHDTEDLCRLITDTAVTLEEWRNQRQIQARSQDTSLLELGFSTFFMNRTNHSGIITGGVIGGQEQLGEWKLDARYNKRDLIKRIQKVARYRNRINISNQDAEHFIRDIIVRLPINTLIYLDPPYYNKGQELYKTFYQPRNHADIANLVRIIPQYWIVSYDDVPEIVQLYREYNRIIYSLNYSAAERYQGSETMFFCERLRIPPVVSPTRVNDRLLNRAQARLPLE